MVTLGVNQRETNWYHPRTMIFLFAYHYQFISFGNYDPMITMKYH